MSNETPKLINAYTKVYITGTDGTSTMTMEQFCNCIRGGTKMEEIEMTFDPEYSKQLEAKRRNVQELTAIARRMSPRQLEKTIRTILSNKELSELLDD